MSLDSDIAACAALVERGDPWRFRCAMASPFAARQVLFPLYAFNLEVARAPWLTSEPMIAEMRLQWWRDALEEIATGGAVRRHEVATPLARILDPDVARMLDGLVAARRWDIYRDPFEDADHFDRYIDQTSGHLMWAAARILGAKDQETVRGAAYASGIARLLHAIPALEDRGRVPLLDGTPEGVRTLADRALERLNAARQCRTLLPRSARAALLPTIGADRILRAARAKPALVANGTLPDPAGTLRSSVQLATGRW